jgi:glycosyltransferase involved in cell wall biosynthesis
MKIVYITSRSLSNIGGIETYMKNLCPLLVEKGHEIILYTEGSGWGKYNFEGVDVVTVPSINSKFFNKILSSFLATFHSLAFNRNVDLYHYNAVPAGIFSFIPKLLNNTVVFQGHGFEWKRIKWSKFTRMMIKLIDFFVILINNNITMVSKEQSNYFNNRQIITITPGVDIKDSQFSSEILTKFSIVKNEYILYLGRLVQEKKPEILIDAFTMSNINNLQLVIAGDDPNEKEYIQSLKINTNKNNNIIFTGAVYGDDKEALLQNCKVFCIPSELEGLPITLLEAMSYGKLCIASDIQANKEALGDTGLYFELNNASDLSNIISNLLCLDSTLGERSKQRVADKFLWTSVASQFEDYYKQCIGK